jgi:hypothetical protein
MTKLRIISNELFRIAIKTYRHPSKSQIALLEKGCDDIYAPVILRVATYRRKLHRLYERQCTGYPDAWTAFKNLRLLLPVEEKDEAETERLIERLIERTESKFKKFAAEHEVTFRLNRDPRSGAIQDLRLTPLTDDIDLTYLIY